MRSGFRVLVLASLSGGCGGPDGGFGGIWMFTMSSYTEAEPSVVITHNYNDAVEPTDDAPTGPWTFTESADQSDSILMAEIVGLDGAGQDGAVMIIGGVIFPGHETVEKDSWDFVWDNYEDQEHSQTHTDGYTFTSASFVHVVTTIHITFDGSAATGTISYDVETQSNYTESELWDPTDNGILYSQLPSSFNLFDAAGAGLLNRDATTECVADPCWMDISWGYDGSAPFSGAWTRYQDAGAYDSVDLAGQPFGTGNVPYYYY